MTSHLADPPPPPLVEQAKKWKAPSSEDPKWEPGIKRQTVAARCLLAKSMDERSKDRAAKEAADDAETIAMAKATAIQVATKAKKQAVALRQQDAASALASPIRQSSSASSTHPKGKRRRIPLKAAPPSLASNETVFESRASGSARDSGIPKAKPKKSPYPPKGWQQH